MVPARLLRAPGLLQEQDKDNTPDQIPEQFMFESEGVILDPSILMFGALARSGGSRRAERACTTLWSPPMPAWSPPPGLTHLLVHSPPPRSVMQPSSSSAPRAAPAAPRP